ncbi:MAG: YbhB/YbcL family Raf kinase inhibitor-like protein [PVC group bacterium]
MTYRMPHVFMCMALFLAGVLGAGEVLSGGEEAVPDAAMRVNSPAFADGAMIPPRYSLRGGNISPPLVIEQIPEKARSLALTVADPDSPRQTWIHWVVYDIPVTNRIDAGTIPGREGLNDFGRRKYDGPTPPSGTHRYVFTVYALDRMLQLPEGATGPGLAEAMRGHILARAQLTGLYRHE